MTEIEKIEKLRDKANVTFAEAKEALDNSGGDMLDAFIYLENNGTVKEPDGGGFYSGADNNTHSNKTEANNYSSKDNTNSGDDFGSLMKKFGDFCLNLFNKGINNHLEATKGDQHLFSCPVLVVIILVLCFFWATIPLFIISLFFGFRYHFSGDDLGNDSVNSVMDGASNVVNDVKRSFTESSKKTDD